MVFCCTVKLHTNSANCIVQYILLWRHSQQLSTIESLTSLIECKHILVIKEVSHYFLTPALIQKSESGRKY